MIFIVSITRVVYYLTKGPPGPPQVQLDGPDQLLPFNMLTYSCLTTPSNNNITWTVYDLFGEDVEFTQFNSQESESGSESVIELYADEGLDYLVVKCVATNKAGDAYQEIVAYRVGNIEYLLLVINLDMFHPLPESPASVEITAPDLTVAGSEMTYTCSSPVSSPIQSIRWEVTDLHHYELDFKTGKKMAFQLILKNI